MTKQPSRKERRESARKKGTVDRAERHELIANAYKQPVVMLEVEEGTQFWRRGDVLFGEDALDLRMHSGMVACIGVRWDALMAGVCDCGGRVGLSRQGLLLVPHAVKCEGTDQKLLRHWDQHLADLRAALVVTS